MKTIISAENQILDAAAAQIKKTLLVRKNAVLALAGGRSVRGLYERLLRMYDCGEISFAGVRALALTELLDVPENMSCRKVILENFLCKTDISTANVHFPDPEHPEHYEELIAECGGIDIAVLGIGENAHIGYNEPATPFASVTHVQKLTDATRHQLEKQHPYAEKLPEKAVTMGIKTITQARDIIVLAMGEDKSQAVHKMLYGRNDSVAPAAFLQIPLNVNVYLDEAASSGL